jgi:hypothetical protein
MFHELTGVKQDRIALVPNSPRGVAAVRRSSFLRDRLKLKDGARLLVAPGSFAPEFMTRETAEAAGHLSGPWYCVLHSALRYQNEDPYFQSLREFEINGRTLFSLEPVPHDCLENVFASADIGLALYGEVGGPNTTEVGLASGKLCHFLKMGVPVIVSDYGKLRELAVNHGVGVAIRKAAEIPAAVKTIEEDYAGFSKRAAQYFNEELAFDSRFSTVLQWLNGG